MSKSSSILYTTYLKQTYVQVHVCTFPVVSLGQKNYYVGSDRFGSHDQVVAKLFHFLYVVFRPFPCCLFRIIVGKKNPNFTFNLPFIAQFS